MTFVLSLPFSPVIEIVLRSSALYVRSAVIARTATESRSAVRMSLSQWRTVESRSIVARSRKRPLDAGVTVSGVRHSAMRLSAGSTGGQDWSGVGREPWPAVPAR